MAWVGPQSELDPRVVLVASDTDHLRIMELGPGWGTGQEQLLGGTLHTKREVTSTVKHEIN